MSADNDLLGVRQLSHPEAEAFGIARLAAGEMMPYFSHVLFAMKLVAAPDLRSMAVDAHWRLYVNPAILDGPGAWPIQVLTAGILHETEHLILDHTERARALPGPLNELAWNLACDAVINKSLQDARIPLWAEAITPDRLGLPADGSAEDYYDELTRRDPSWLAAFDDGGPGCGSGAGMPAIPGELPWGGPAGFPGLDEAAADMVRREVARDIQAPRSYWRARGTVPAGLDRWASRILTPPVVPWQTVLAGAIRDAVDHERGRVTRTYMKPSRRQIPGGVIMPGRRAPLILVRLVADTSGSMGQQQLDAVLSEIDGLLHTSGVRRDQIDVITCDAAAATPQRVRSAADIQLTGGGGTDMRVGIDAAAKLNPEPNVIIVLTDGITPWPDQPPRPRLVCAVISPDPPQGTPDWATTVHIPDGPAAIARQATARSAGRTAPDRGL